MDMTYETKRQELAGRLVERDQGPLSGGWTYIQSSNLRGAAWNQGTLYLLFKSGASYAYDNVPYTVFDALQKVESAGKFFNQMIRNKFHHTHLTTDPFTGLQEAA